MLDLHTHILPEVDDGSSSAHMSVAMLEAEARQGIPTVVATPHFYAHRDMPDDFFARRERGHRLLSDAIGQRTDLPRVLLGAEVAFYNGMAESDILPELCLGGSKYLLLEMPMAPWPLWVYSELLAIHQRQGIIPVLAHVERYLLPLQKTLALKRLASMPVLLQSNASFFLNKRSSRLAMRLLQQGHIHLLGSDCHDTDSRPPRLGQAVEAIRSRLGEEALERIHKYEEQVFAPAPVK